MSRYDKNTGHNGYGRLDSSYKDAINDPDHKYPEGRPHSIFGYSLRQDSERYVEKTKQVVEFRSTPTMVDHEHSPKKNELHNGHAILNRLPQLSWSSTRDGQPKAEDHAAHSPGKGSPREGRYFHAPTMVDHEHSPKKNELHNGQGLPNRLPQLSWGSSRDGQPKAEDHAAHSPGKGSPREGRYFHAPTMVDHEHSPKKNELHSGHALPNRLPLLSWGSSRDGQPEKGQAFSPKAEDHAAYSPGKGSPLSKINVSSPREDRYFHGNGKAKETRFNEEENVFAPPSSYNVQISSNQPRKAPSYYENEKNRGVISSAPSPYKTQPIKYPNSEASKDEKNKGIGYAPPIHTTQPIKDEKNKGIGYAPHSTQPRKDAYHETSQNGKNRGNLSFAPSHTGSVMGRGRRDDGYQETIDSWEAKRRYGGAMPKAQTYEENYTETIDCIEAARKYNGVLVPY